MKFGKDRMRWRHWIYQAKKRYGLCVLNYIATSNHIHLLVLNTMEDVIPKSMQLIAGRTAQEYNQRKKRKGAFWEDRYHATAVEADEHLAKCLVYIDLNMVRAGVVKHPSEYFPCGFNEIWKPPERYGTLDRTALLELFFIGDEQVFRKEHQHRVEMELEIDAQERKAIWSESIAVGSKVVVEKIQKQLGSRAVGRSTIMEDGLSALKEPQASYRTLFEDEKAVLRLKNSYS